MASERFQGYIYPNQILARGRYSVTAAERMDAWMDRSIDPWMDGWMDGWMDRQATQAGGTASVEVQKRKNMDCE